MHSKQSTLPSGITDNLAAQPLRGAIVGQGAIGLLAACRLALAGRPLPLIQRQPTAALAVTFSQQQQDFPLLLCTDISPPLDFLLLPVKAFAVEQALKQYQSLLSPSAVIVLCHNGLGTLDVATSLLKADQQLWFASTTHGALKTGPHRLRHTGLGQTIVGPIAGPNANSIAALGVSPITAPLAGSPNRPTGMTLCPQYYQLLDTALGPLQHTDNILPVLWRKLAINALINPLTALYQVRNGALADATFQPLLQQLLDEFLQVANICGQHFNRAELWASVQQVIEATAANYSSMQQDVQQQRQTELAYINGYLLQQAQVHQLTLPTHQRLVEALQALIDRTKPAPPLTSWSQ